jgi:hypothetical protein
MTELIAHSARAVLSKVSSRCNSRNRLEDALKVKTAHSGRFGESIEIRYIIRVLNAAASRSYRGGAP